MCAGVESTLAGVESTLAGVDVDTVSGPVVIYLLMCVLVLKQH